MEKGRCLRDIIEKEMIDMACIREILGTQPLRNVK